MKKLSLFKYFKKQTDNYEIKRKEMYAAQDLYRLLNRIKEGTFSKFHICNNNGPNSTTPNWIVYLANGSAFEIFFWEKEEEENWEDYDPVCVSFFWGEKSIIETLEFIKSNLP